MIKIIIIYDKNTTNFNNLGIGTLIPKSCIVKEELNGIYELELIHTYDNLNKWQKIENEFIIFVPTPKGYQAFRIYNIIRTMDEIKINAKHIFYDLNDNLIMSKKGEFTAQQFLNNLSSELLTQMPFLFKTNIEGENKFINVKNINPVFILLSVDENAQSFIKLYGGEIERDNFNINILSEIGTDRGFQIRYRKNLIGLEVTENLNDVVTKIIPKANIQNNEIIGDIVESKYINNYVYPKIEVIEFSDVNSVKELNEKAKKFFDNQIDLPKINIKVDFIILGNTEEYKKYKDLEKCLLGDIVTIINEKMNFTKKAKVKAYEWDCLKKQYNSLELGDFQEILTSTITTNVNNTNTAINANKTANNIYNLINGNVTITDKYIYLPVDSENYLNATKLYRLGKNGIEFSETGFNGKYNILLAAENK